MTAALIGIALLLLGLLVWRAGSGPVMIDTLAPQLAQILSNPGAGLRAEVAHAQLMWSKDDQALRLVAITTRIFDRQDRLIAELPQLSLGLNFLASLHGQSAPVEIFSNNLNLRFLRTPDGSLHFGEWATSPEEEQGATPDIAGYMREFLRLETGWSGLGLIGAVKAERLDVIVSDQATRQDWSIKASRLHMARSRTGLTAKGWLEIGLGQGQDSTILLDAAYNARDKAITLRAQFSGLNLSRWADKEPRLAKLAFADIALGGVVEAGFDENLQWRRLHVDLSGQGGRLVRPDLWPKPLPVTTLRLKGDADLDARRLLGEAALDAAGVKIALHAQGAPGPGPDDIAVTAAASVGDWPLERLTEIWPEGIAPNPRAWIAANITAGTFGEVAASAAFNTSLHDPSDARDFALKGKISLAGATIHYLDGMPPVTGVDAVAEADRSTLRIEVKGGKADHVVLGPSPVVIDGLDSDRQTISIGLTGKNSVGDVLRLIDHPPLGYAKALGLSPQDVAGTADLDVKLGFPLIKILPLDAIHIDARAKIADLASDKLIKGLPITGGQFDLAVDAAKMSVAGQAAFSGVPMKAEYKQQFAAMQVPGDAPDSPATALQSEAMLTGVLSPANWTALGVDFGKDASGDTPVTVKYAKGFSGPATLELDADFTQAAMAIGALNWSKTASQPTSAKAKLVFGGKKGEGAKLALALAGPQMNLKAEGAVDPETMRPQNIACDPCKAGRNDIRARLSFAKDGGVEGTISGAALDYREPEEKSAVPPGTAKTKPLRLKINVEKLYRGGGEYFSKFRAVLRRDEIGWDKIELRALAGGKVPFTVTLLPEAVKLRRLTVTTDDFGAVLRAAGMTEEISGGKLVIMGNSTPAYPRRIEGEVKLKNYRVYRLPFLAVLLNAVSFTGFADLMSGSGIGFDRLEGKYVWEGQKLRLDDVRTSGGALGLNVEGGIDFAASSADLQGTVVPFSFVNKVIGLIPLVGDILTGGGGGGVFAATYQATGDLDDLQVSVNPVSILAPGIVRRIFFQ